MRYGRVLGDVNFPENYFAEGENLSDIAVPMTISRGRAKITTRKRRTSDEIATEGP